MCTCQQQTAQGAAHGGYGRKRSMAVLLMHIAIEYAAAQGILAVWATLLRPPRDMLRQRRSGGGVHTRREEIAPKSDASYY
jgi:hypothetical protein